MSLWLIVADSAISVRHAMLMVVVASACACGAPASQERSIEWSRNVEQAVAKARQTKLPLMFWVLGRSASRDHRIERDQKHAFANPLVVELSSRFVPVRLSRSRYRDQLEKWGLPPKTNLEIVFTTPAGEKIDTLSAGGVRDPGALTRKMALVFQAYRGQIFEKELKEKLENEETSEKDLRAALKLIRELIIMPAALRTIALLDRDKLSDALRKDVYDTLAVLSSAVCVDALLEHAVADPRAAEALAHCTPEAAELMLDSLGGDDPDLHLIAYHAVTRICRISNVKSDRFWQGHIQALKDKELKRVRQLVTETAKRWKERYAEYR